ncbi:hypothetical protein V5O48_010549 [Marasmius crinis-equi]|uniref:Uncharacterized protein n=1 Tax=Marasmius crinis-equi TaxID=585013 RepID=A0ABR3F862_9AGAR
MSESQDLDVPSHSGSEISVDDAADVESQLAGESLLDLENLDDDMETTLPDGLHATTSWPSGSGADWVSPTLDNNGWGVPASPTPPRIGYFPWKNQGWVADHVRGDLEESGWSLNGNAQRDTALDGLASKEWAPIQLFRLTDGGRSGNAPAPTFTQAQVAARLGDILLTLSEKKQAAARLERNIRALEGAAARLRVRKKRVESQMREIEVTRGDLEDLHLAGLTFGHS